MSNSPIDSVEEVQVTLPSEKNHEISHHYVMHYETLLVAGIKEMMKNNKMRYLFRTFLLLVAYGGLLSGLLEQGLQRLMEAIKQESWMVDYPYRLEMFQTYSVQLATGISILLCTVVLVFWMMSLIRVHKTRQIQQFLEPSVQEGLLYEFILSKYHEALQWTGLDANQIEEKFRKQPVLTVIRLEEFMDWVTGRVGRVMGSYQVWDSKTLVRYIAMLAIRRGLVEGVIQDYDEIKRTAMILFNGDNISKLRIDETV